MNSILIFILILFSIALGFLLYLYIKKVTEYKKIYSRFKGVIDIEKERLRINRQIDNLKLQLNDKLKRLKDNQFIRNAPQQVVEAEKERVRNLQERLRELKRISHEL